MGSEIIEVVERRRRWPVEVRLAGSDSGGERAALFYALIRTATLNGVGPEAYLGDANARIGSHSVNRLHALPLWNIVAPATQSIAA
jgi:transposase